LRVFPSAIFFATYSNVLGSLLRAIECGHPEGAVELPLAAAVQAVTGAVARGRWDKCERSLALDTPLFSTFRPAPALPYHKDNPGPRSSPSAPGFSAPTPCTDPLRHLQLGFRAAFGLPVFDQPDPKLLRADTESEGDFLGCVPGSVIFRFSSVGSSM